VISVSKKVEYSVELIAYLSQRTDEVVSLSQVSEDLHLPYRFLGQLALGLRRGGIIEGREGKNGGYILAKNWQEKSMYDLLEALGENKGLVECLGKDSVCVRAGKCRIRRIWQRVEAGITDDLKGIKLNEIKEKNN
jgi:Rrf2 family protein